MEAAPEPLAKTLLARRENFTPCAQCVQPRRPPTTGLKRKHHVKTRIPPAGSLLLGLAASLALGAAAAAAPAVTTFSLDNGLQGVVIEDHRAPAATHMVWYKVGAADEEPGFSGMAHFLEHLTFKGTETFASGDFSRIIADHGGVDNAGTTHEYTTYYQRIAPQWLPLVMEMEAERMSRLDVDAEQVDVERQVVLEERMSRVDSDPVERFGEEMKAALYKNHRYRVPAIGWRHEIESLSLDKAVEFYRRHYGPNRAVLVVAGDVDPEQVEAWARAYYGPLAPIAGERPPRAREPASYAARRVEMRDARVVLPLFQRFYATATTADPVDGPALALLAQILGSNDSADSRLRRALIEGEEAPAAYAGARYQGEMADIGTFSIFAFPKDASVDMNLVESIVDREIARMIAEGPAEQELARAKTIILSDALFAQDNQFNLAERYGAALAVGRTIEEVEAWPDRLRAVTPEQVAAAAGRWLKIERSVTGRLQAAQTESAP